jgi:cob(I)alamin adenosyltransferase
VVEKRVERLTRSVESLFRGKEIFKFMAADSLKKGLILIYIGNGKGKTTAAVGLVVRAAGANKKVLFAQFVKAQQAKERGEWPESSEIAVLKNLKGVTVKILGWGFVGILGDSKKKPEHVQAARQGLAWLAREIKQKKFDVIIADELISALELKLLKVEDVKKLFGLKNNFQALVLTGHKKYNELTVAADLVTEMKMLKHPYYKGLVAQRGIDY